MLTQDYQEIIDRFERIRDAARHNEPLPEDLIYRCDVNCYEDLKRLFVGHKILKNITKDELFEKGSDYKNAYITEYKHTVLQAKIYKEDHERRMRASQAEARLIKEDLSLKEIYRILFFDLLPKVIPPQSAEKIFQSVGVKMWACGSLESTPENVKVIRKIIMED